MNNTAICVLVVTGSAKMLTISGKWMSFLLNNTCCLSQGKGLLVCTSCSSYFSPLPTTLSRFSFVVLELSSLLWFLSLLLSAWSPVHSPLLISAFLLGVSHGGTVLSEGGCLCDTQASYHPCHDCQRCGTMEDERYLSNCCRDTSRCKAAASPHQFYSQIHLCHKAEEIHCATCPSLCLKACPQPWLCINWYHVTQLRDNRWQEISWTFLDQCITGFTKHTGWP